MLPATSCPPPCRAAVAAAGTPVVLGARDSLLLSATTAGVLQGSAHLPAQAGHPSPPLGVGAERDGVTGGNPLARQPGESDAQFYWREIFEHWVEDGRKLPDFCFEFGYDVQKTYAAFYQRFYRKFILRQQALGVKCGKARAA